MVLDCVFLCEKVGLDYTLSLSVSLCSANREQHKLTLLVEMEPVS